MVKYTYYGDANLDGKVDGQDYALIDAGYLSHGTLTGWYNGDFNYDGEVDASDYTLIDNAFNLQAGTIGSSVVASPTALVAAATDEIAPVTGTSAVPEPASVGLLAAAAARPARPPPPGLLIGPHCRSDCRTLTPVPRDARRRGGTGRFGVG